MGQLGQAEKVKKRKVQSKEKRAIVKPVNSELSKISSVAVKQVCCGQYAGR